MMRRSSILAITAAVLLIAGIWVATHRSSTQSDLGGGSLFADLAPALGEVSEIRLSKGDGSRTTLRKEADGWIVVERQYPADASRVRELALGLANMKIIERKTSDPANYARLGVESPDSPTATGTLVEVVAGQKTWSLIVGKGAEGRSIYVRRPDEAASALAQPSVSPDPDQKRWLDRRLTDIEGSDIHEIEVKPASGPGWRLVRATRDASDLELTPVPKGRKPMDGMTLGDQANVLSAFNVDEVRAAPSSPPAAVDKAVYRTFDGQVFEFAGYKQGEKAFVSVAARHDDALAAKFAQPATPPAADAADAADKPAAPAASPAPEAPAPKTAARDLERLATRSKGVEYEIPLYKYESLFKPLDGLLEAK